LRAGVAQHVQPFGRFVSQAFNRPKISRGDMKAWAEEPSARFRNVSSFRAGPAAGPE
jgi:hypothetical protein